MSKPIVYPYTCVCGKEILNPQARGGHRNFCPRNKDSPVTKHYISNIKALRLVVKPTIRDRETRIVKDPGETIEFSPDTSRRLGKYSTNSPRYQQYIESLPQFCGRMGSGQKVKSGSAFMIWEE